MNRFQMEHAVMSASRITGEKEFVIIGSQAIHGAAPNAPGRLSESMEIDIYPLNNPSKAIEIDGNMGEGTIFEATHGYYAHEVGPNTAKLPSNWKDRLVKFSTPYMEGAVALCLSPVDLACSKLLASREKDFDFVTEMIHYGFVKPYQIRKMVNELKPEEMSFLEKNLMQCETRARDLIYGNDAQRNIDKLRNEYSKVWRDDITMKGRKPQGFYENLYEIREEYDNSVCENREDALKMLPEELQGRASKLDSTALAELLHTQYRDGVQEASKILPNPLRKKNLKKRKMDEEEEEESIKM